MTWEIAFVLGLLLLALLAFLWEKYPPDVVALAVFCTLLLTQVLPREKAMAVFANPAPITVAALFVLSAALVRCGALDYLSSWFEKAAVLPYQIVLFLLIALIAFVSAWINNTPVVVVFVPVILNLARKMKLPASKFLIPLSYASVLGGSCTLIGTSTNLVVNGILVDRGEPAMSMLELASIGVPAAVIGALYLSLAGKYLLPARESLTSILSDEERREYLTEAFVPPASPLIGKSLKSAGLVSARGFRVIEVVRDGVAITVDPEVTPLSEGDRLVLSCRPSGIARARAMPGFDFTAEAGLEQIAAHEGVVFEGAVAPNSELIGRSISELNFRQRYRAIVLAVLRDGENVREKIETLPLQMGDILLLMGTPQAVAGLRQGDDIILFDRPPLPSFSLHTRIPLVLATLAAVILGETFGVVPIEVGSIAGAVLMCLTGCLKPKDAYDAIEWRLLFVIFGMLALGATMQHTGAAAWVANNIVSGVNLFVSGPHKPMVMLACLYLVTMVLTEILSNNAVAALMTPIAIGMAAAANVDPRPFVIAVCFAASAAFATPIGYQTNTYVYGIGGYRFKDFVKIGVPLNLICFAVAMYVIPTVWPF
ncbi:TRAP transporter large permease subunit [Oleiharenicola lentus]|uniref:TRAP transporter large permease subunit n=1 Tax=Oleiharenicola lentus TaxID=2508720 RepID=A0A4Q1C3I5_9BACT|nr:SLC13 family permease [Oleiharenicola lentus]RXK52799.1 TRAP transporter large permease subunit [Oleiharenicola lentus]